MAKKCGHWFPLLLIPVTASFYHKGNRDSKGLEVGRGEEGWHPTREEFDGGFSSVHRTVYRNSRRACLDRKWAVGTLGTGQEHTTVLEKDTEGKKQHGAWVKPVLGLGGDPQMREGCHNLAPTTAPSLTFLTHLLLPGETHGDIARGSRRGGWALGGCSVKVTCTRRTRRTIILHWFCLFVCF